MIKSEPFYRLNLQQGYSSSTLIEMDILTSLCTITSKKGGTILAPISIGESGRF